MQHLPAQTDNRQFLNAVLSRANAYIQTGELDAAAEVLANAIETDTSTSNNPSEVRTLLAKLAEIYGLEKDWHDQEKTFAKLAAIWTDATGPNSAVVAHYRLAQAAAYEKSGDPVNAAIVERSAIPVLDALYGPHNLAIETALQNCAIWEGTPRPAGVQQFHGFEPSEPGLTRPKLLSKVEPAFSEQARQARYDGTVLLKILVSAQGTVDQVSVVDPLGLGLDEEAIKAVKQWKFKPGFKDGTPVPVIDPIEVNFHLL
jgi:TonB family protein